MNTPDPMPLKLEGLCRALSDATRWRILRELSKGEPLPVQELARRVGRPRAQVSKHMAMLREVGVAIAVYGRLYRFTPGVRVLAEERLLDLGYCLVRLDAVP